MGAQAPGAERGAGPLPGGWVGTGAGRWRPVQHAALPGPVLDACLGCDPPPPEAVGWTTPAPSLALERGVLGQEVGGREAAPHLPDAGARKLTRRFERQPPRPHPGKPVRETDSLRDPDINAVRRAGRRLAGPRPLRPPLHVRPGLRWHGQGPAPPSWGRPEELRRIVSRELPPPQSKVGYPLPSSLLSSQEQAAIARWL